MNPLPRTAMSVGLLVAAKYDCEFLGWLTRRYKNSLKKKETMKLDHIIVCDKKCVIRDMVVRIILDEFASEQNKRYEKEYPNG